MICGRLMDRFGLDQLEEGGLGFEQGSVRALHLEIPGHRAKGRRQRTARSVFEALTGLENRLLSNDSRSVDLFRMACAIDDRPMSIQQLDRRISDVGNLNRVKEKPATHRWVAVLRRITRTDSDSDACSLGFGTGCEGIFFGHALELSSLGSDHGGAG